MNFFCPPPAAGTTASCCGMEQTWMDPEAVSKHPAHTAPASVLPPGTDPLLPTTAGDFQPQLFHLVMHVWDLWPQASSTRAFILPCPRGQHKPTARGPSSRSQVDLRNICIISWARHLVLGLYTCRAWECTTTLWILREL